MTTLLSIDWDWVTGDCADAKDTGGYGHGCCGWCSPPRRRLTRGADRLVQAGWIERLEALNAMSPVDTGGNLWVAECHADILRIVDPDETTEIVHLDSHMDDADWCGLSCGSWRTFLPKGIDVVVAALGGLREVSFHDVFVCQSSPWTPAPMDKFLWDLVASLAYTVGRDPVFIGHRRMAQTRAWRQAEARRSPEVPLAVADGA